MVLKPHFFYWKFEGRGLKPYEKIGFSELCLARLLALPWAPWSLTLPRFAMLESGRTLQGFMSGDRGVKCEDLFQTLFP